MSTFKAIKTISPYFFATLLEVGKELMSFAGIRLSMKTLFFLLVRWMIIWYLLCFCSLCYAVFQVTLNLGRQRSQYFVTE